MNEIVTKIVKYRVKKKKLAKVKKELGQFVEAVKKNEPDTILYETFQEKDDPVSFVHIMSFKDRKAERTHTKSQHVQKFVKALYPNCKDEPEFINLRALKSTKGSENTTQNENVLSES